MSRRRLLTKLFNKFKWSFFLLIILVFLISYSSFITRLNLWSNLAFNKKLRGNLHYPFGKYPIIKKIEKTEIIVNWNSLLTILVTLYFPFKIVTQLLLSYLRKYYERRMKVYLVKKLVIFAYKNKDKTSQYMTEKIMIINNTTTNFSEYFFSFFISLVKILVGVCLDFFCLCLFIKSRKLLRLNSLIIIFCLVNSIWVFIFYLFAKKKRLNERRKIDCENQEKGKMKNLLESLTSTNENYYKGLGKTFDLLDDNSELISFFTFLSTFYELPKLIIYGTNLFFLFFYYHFFNKNITWNEYLIANSLQSIFIKIVNIFDVWSSLFFLRKFYWQIKDFFTFSEK